MNKFTIGRALIIARDEYGYENYRYEAVYGTKKDVIVMGNDWEKIPKVVTVKKILHDYKNPPLVITVPISCPKDFIQSIKKIEIPAGYGSVKVIKNRYI